MLLVLLAGCGRDPAPQKTEVTFGCAQRVQEYTVESTGYYLLEVWGAQGGTCAQNTDSGFMQVLGGLGGYAAGYVKLEKGTVLYIAVGGQGGNYNADEKTGTGGYNGGGYAIKTSSVNHIFGGGGGGEVGGLGEYRGADAMEAEDFFLYKNKAATQTNGYAFGKGENDSSANAGGGGGWYGGYGGTSTGTGSGCGGSGYVGTLERSKMESGVREGNGLARISWIGYSLPKE